MEAVLAKARRRLIPFLFLLYIVAYLDRINVGAINDATHSFAAGLLAIAAVLTVGGTMVLGVRHAA